MFTLMNLNSEAKQRFLIVNCESSKVKWTYFILKNALAKRSKANIAISSGVWQMLPTTLHCSGGGSRGGGGVEFPPLAYPIPNILQIPLLPKFTQFPNSCLTLFLFWSGCHLTSNTTRVVARWLMLEVEKGWTSRPTSMHAWSLLSRPLHRLRLSSTSNRRLRQPPPKPVTTTIWLSSQLPTAHSPAERQPGQQRHYGCGHTVKVALLKNNLLRHIALLNFNGAMSVDSLWKKHRWCAFVS